LFEGRNLLYFSGNRLPLYDFLFLAQFFTMENGKENSYSGIVHFMIFCWGHSFYCSKRKAKFHKVETGHQTFAESVVKHAANSKLKPRSRDDDSTDGVIRQFAHKG